MRERKRRSEFGYMSIRSAFGPISSKTHKPLRTHVTGAFFLRSMNLLHSSQPSHAVLLVNVPVALLLHPVLQHHGDAEDEDEVNANNAKGSGEDLVQILVCEGGEWDDASTLLGCNESVGASVVLDKWRCRGVDITAAIELSFVSTLV